MAKKNVKNPELTKEILSKADMIKDLFINLDYLNRLILKANVKLKKQFNVVELIAILEVYPNESNKEFDTIYRRIIEAVESLEISKELGYKTRIIVPDTEYGGLFSKRFL